MYEKQKITEILPAKSGVGKNGKPYSFYKIKTDRQGDKTLTTFGDKVTANWKVGDEIEIKVTQSVSPDGKYTNYNFEYPKEPSVSERVKLLEIDMDMIKRKLGLPTGFDDVKQAREAHNANRPVSDGYTSRGYNGEAPIKVSSVTFDPNDINYPTDEVDISSIPF